MDQYIINKSSKLSWLRKLTAFSLSLLFWCILFYLWQPLLITFLDYFEIGQVVEREILAARVNTLIETFVSYGIVVLILAITFIIWAKYNQINYGRNEKRTFRKNIPDQDIAEYFKIPENDLKHWQQQKNLTVSLSEQNDISVTTNPPGSIKEK